MTFDEQLRAVPDLAERLDNPEPTMYVVTLRRGVRFHDGHELTSADVVYTFRSLLEPDFVTPHKGAFQLLQSIDASDRYTVVFRLREPFGSFPVALVLPQIVPARRQPIAARAPGRHGAVPVRPLRRRRPARPGRVSTATSADARGMTASCSRSSPTTSWRASSFARARPTSSSTTSRRTSSTSSNATAASQPTQSPGVDYQYIGLNLRDPVLKDVRVRQAIGYAIDRRRDHRVPAPRDGDSSDGDPAADLLGLRSRRVLVLIRSSQGPRAARRSRLPRS